jgi:hypothetical protein
MENKQPFLLTESEINLIRLIRYKYRFGEIIIITNEGSPVKIKKVDYFDLTRGDLKKSNPQIDWDFLKKCDE